MFAQSTNTEEIPEASETNVDLDYVDNEDGGKLGRLFFTVTTTLILMTMMDVDYEEDDYDDDINIRMQCLFVCL